MYLRDSEANVAEGGSVSCFNNHAADDGGKRPPMFVLLLGGFLPSIFMFYLCVLSPRLTHPSISISIHFFSLSGAITLSSESVFNIYGNASFVSNEAPDGGEM